MENSEAWNFVHGPQPRPKPALLQIQIMDHMVQLPLKGARLPYFQAVHVGAEKDREEGL